MFFLIPKITIAGMPTYIPTLGTFNDFYYSFSPIIADYECENPIFKEMVKVAITPMIQVFLF